MALTVDLWQLFNVSKYNSSKVTIEATVASGFESVAMSECVDKLGIITNEICKSRGRVFFNTDASQIQTVLSLKSIDNVYVIADVVQLDSLQGDKEKDLAVIKQLAHQPDWKKAITIWQENVYFHGKCYPTEDEYFTALQEEKKIKEEVKVRYQSIKDTTDISDLHNGPLDSENLNDSKECSDTCDTHKLSTEGRSVKHPANPKDRTRKIYQEIDQRHERDKVLKYRVTCYRTGSHSFGSQDAAYHLGGELQDLFHWIVDLVHFDLDTVLNIKDDEVYIGIALTKESMHRRNIKEFGPTTLRATVCYCLLHLGEPKPGDVVIDPLCGVGSIPIEGALSFAGTYYLCGDNHPKAIAHSYVNIQNLPHGIDKRVDVLSWNVKQLPLRDSSVDVFVTDLPFGKRIGSKHNNKTLYKVVLSELGRVVRQVSGRAVLLTHDKKNLMRTLSHTHKLWTLVKIIGVNIGGLDAAVYVLKRTCNEALSAFNYFRITSRKNKKLKSS